jgi:hypothetical protein
MALERPETELLLCCARLSSDSNRAEQLRALLHKDLDWAILRRIAHQHGVVPLLYWRLSNTCPEAVPTAVLDRLRGDFHANCLRNLSLTRELLRLLNLLEAQGIPRYPLQRASPGRFRLREPCTAAVCRSGYLGPQARCPEDQRGLYLCRIPVGIPANSLARSSLSSIQT